MLSIDTEGFDALVLRGAETTLVMARVVEFEYHRSGAWGNLSLWDTLSHLRSRWRYRCYWQGDFRHSGALVPIDEGCSSNLSHFWSNVVCAKDHDILRIFDDMLPDYMGGLWKTNRTRRCNDESPNPWWSIIKRSCQHTDRQDRSVTAL